MAEGQNQPANNQQAGQGRLLYGQMADYTTETEIEKQLDMIMGTLNKYIYSDFVDVSVDPMIKADADTLIRKIIFFVNKQPSKPSVLVYEQQLELVVKTRNLKRIKNAISIVSKEFSVHARDLQYNAPRVPKLKGLHFLVQRLQLEKYLTEKDMKIIKNQNEKKRSLHYRTCYTYCCQLVRHDGDIQLILSGAPGLGKGTLGMRILRTCMKIMKNEFGIDVGSTKWNDIITNNIIYRPKKGDFNDLLQKKQFNFKMIDEGYLLGTNLESNTDLAIFTAKITNITRSKNNLMIHCFQNPTRATKMLMEAFYSWMCKYNDDYALVLQRTKIFTTKDPWSLKKILDSQFEGAIETALATNSNKVNELKTKKVPDWVFKKYKILKDEEQNKWRLENEAKGYIQDVKIEFAMEIRKAVNTHLLNGEDSYDIEQYIRKKYPKFKFTRKQITSIIKVYKDYDWAMVIQEAKQ